MKLFLFMMSAAAYAMLLHADWRMALGIFLLNLSDALYELYGKSE